MKRLTGVIPAIPTPLLPNEDVDADGLRRLIDMVVEDGASGVFVLGSMGEGAALLDGQKALAARTAAKHINGAVPLLVSIADVSARRTLECGLRLQDAGPDYLVSTGPYYYKFPDSRSPVGFFEMLSNALQVPLVYYHQPAFTGNAYDAATIESVLSLPKIAALKDSSCNFSLVGDLIRRNPDPDKRPFSILQGDESVFDLSLLLGADGVVTGGGTLFIKTLVLLFDAAQRQDRLAAFELQRQFRSGLLKILGPNLATDWMAAIKNELKLRGICDNVCTAPFVNRFRTAEAAGSPGAAASSPTT